MQTSVQQKQLSLFTHVPLQNKSSLGSAAICSSTPNNLRQVPQARCNVNMSTATLSKPATISKPEVTISKPEPIYTKPSFNSLVGQVPPLQVDDLLDFQFPLKTSIRDAHQQKWTNPRTGQIYNWQQPAPIPQPSRGVDLDQMLDWNFSKGKGFEGPNSQKSRTTAPQMNVGNELPFDLLPSNYQMQVTNQAPVVTNMSNANGIIENYIDQYEVFNN